MAKAGREGHDRSETKTTTNNNGLFIRLSLSTIIMQVTEKKEFGEFPLERKWVTDKRASQEWKER